VGSPAQAAGQAAKAELGHRLSSGWLASVRDPTNITKAPVSSSKFDFNIRLTIAFQLQKRFRCWVKSAVWTVGRLLPVFPEKRTFSESFGMSQRCQRLTRTLNDAHGALPQRSSSRRRRYARVR
jgi:hypothetical protein